VLFISRPRIWFTALIAALFLAVIGTVGAALAGDRTATGRTGVLAVDEAQSAVDLLELRLTELHAEVADVRLELGRLEVRKTELSDDQAVLVSEVEEKVRQNRELVVEAFITGGEAEFLRLVGSSRAADYQWQTYLLSNESLQAGELATRLAQLRAATDAEILDLAQQLDSRKAYLEVAEAQLARLEADLPDARLELLVAEAWDQSDRAVAMGRYGEAPPEAWERLRFCESSGDYQAVDETGVYRGAYQFDRHTWRTVGGLGDPAHSSPREQDARARALYARRGNQPWPVCGYHLP